MSLDKLESRLHTVLSDGPKLGYFPKPAKTVIVADSSKNSAEAQFQQYGMSVATGDRHLGSLMGAMEHRAVFREKNLNNDSRKLMLYQTCQNLLSVRVRIEVFLDSSRSLL